MSVQAWVAPTFFARLFALFLIPARCTSTRAAS